MGVRAESEKWKFTKSRKGGEHWSLSKRAGLTAGAYRSEASAPPRDTELRVATASVLLT